MQKDKQNLKEELGELQYLIGFDRTKPHTHQKDLLEYKNFDKVQPKQVLSDKPTKTNVQLEWAPLIAGIARIAPWAVRGLANIGRGGAAAGSRGILKNLPNGLKWLGGFGKVSTQGLKGVPSSLTSKIASGSKIGKGILPLNVSKSIINTQAASGLNRLLTWGTGAYLIGNIGSSGAQVPGNAASAMQGWSEGEELSENDYLSIAFTPEVYDQVEQQGLIQEIPFNFQSESDLSQLAEVIHDATEGGEKYFGKGVVDTLTFGLTKGAGTEEDDIYSAFRQVNSLYDCSHLSGIYQLKFGTPLLEELLDELSEKDFQPVADILRDKPICIIDGQKIYNPDDLNEKIQNLTNDMVNRPEGLPATRVRFKQLFDGDTVDVFVDGNVAPVFIAAGKEYLGQFEYIENSEEKVYLLLPNKKVGAIADEDDRKAVLKIFGKGDATSGGDYELGKSIEVAGELYEKGEDLGTIAGPGGYADVIYDEMVQDNPRTAKRQNHVLQGAAIAYVMDADTFEILQEAYKGLESLLKENHFLGEQKYRRSEVEGKHVVRRVRGKVDDTGGEENTKQKPKKSKSYDSVKECTNVFKMGDKGSGVKQLQKELIRNGYKLPEHGADGDFGSETKAAVNAFLGKSGQSQRGVIDCDDLIALETLKHKDETGGEEVQKDEITTTTTTQRQEKEKEEISKTDVPNKREKLQSMVLNSGDSKQQKNYCKNLIRFEAGMLKSNMKKAENLRALKTCYDNHNFGMGGNSRRVRKSYGLKTSRNIKKTEKF
tara:strand:+ start:921 stop:3224 length:2304 start_codon:yes stop_codon:yes gene_type:complete